MDTDYNNYAVLHITGLILGIIRVKWIIIQSRNPTLSEKFNDKVNLALKDCYPSNWKIVKQNCY